jgi:hypothetical protein
MMRTPQRGHGGRPLAGQGPNPVRSRGRRSPAVPGLLRRELFPRVHARRCDHDRCAMLVRTQDGHRVVRAGGPSSAHDGVGDAMTDGPSRRRRHAAARTGADLTLSGPARLRRLIPATPRRANGRLALRFPRTRLRIHPAVASRDPDSSADGYVRRSGCAGINRQKGKDERARRRRRSEPRRPRVMQRRR